MRSGRAMGLPCPLRALYGAVVRGPTRAHRIIRPTDVTITSPMAAKHLFIYSPPRCSASVCACIHSSTGADGSSLGLSFGLSLHLVHKAAGLYGRESGVYLGLWRGG
jgi:hypothetical protein